MSVIDNCTTCSADCDVLQAEPRRTEADSWQSSDVSRGLAALPTGEPIDSEDEPFDTSHLLQSLDAQARAIVEGVLGGIADDLRRGVLDAVEGLADSDSGLTDLLCGLRGRPMTAALPSDQCEALARLLDLTRSTIAQASQ